MKLSTIIFALLLALPGLGCNAQTANHKLTRLGIVEALPAGVSPEQATTDQIAQAATDLAFNMEGNLEDNIRQVMVSLGELTRAGTFKNAPRFGDRNPPGRFYTKILNLASSNLDVASSTYYSITVQDIIRLTAAARDGMNFLVDAKSNAITRK